MATTNVTLWAEAPWITYLISRGQVEYFRSLGYKIVRKTEVVETSYETLHERNEVFKESA